MENYFSITKEDIEIFFPFKDEPYFHQMILPVSTYEHSFLIATTDSNIQNIINQHGKFVNHVYSRVSKPTKDFLRNIFFEMLLGSNVNDLLNQRYDQFTGPKQSFINELRIVIKNNLGILKSSPEAKEFVIGQVESWISGKLEKSFIDSLITKTNSQKQTNKHPQEIKLENLFYSEKYFKYWLMALKEKKYVSHFNTPINGLKKTVEAASLMYHTNKIHGLIPKRIASHVIAEALNVFFDLGSHYKAKQFMLSEQQKEGGKLSWKFIKSPQDIGSL